MTFGQLDIPNGYNRKENIPDANNRIVVTKQYNAGIEPSTWVWSKEEVEALASKRGTLAHYRKWLAQFKADVGSDNICDQIVDTY